MGSSCLILSACRTPIGAFGGSLGTLSAPRLGAVVVREALRMAKVGPAQVGQVIMGNVLSAGVGQAPARQAALWAELPDSVSTLTINKVCGSGLKAVMLGAQAIATGEAEVVVAGGMESMSLAPYLLGNARWGYRMGHAQLIDCVVKDGLWDVYNNFHMGMAAELLAEKYRLSRKDLDTFALWSYEKALKAQKQGGFKEEIVPVEVVGKDGKKFLVEEDECPKRLDREKMPTLPPSFKKDGGLTAANSSAISDAASALVLVSEDAKIKNLKPIARVLGQAESALAPELFSLAPVGAIKKLLEKTGLRLEDIDLFEINEAFASTGIAISRELELDLKRLNVKGGAIALGHPIGASGARILTTLLSALKEQGAKRGVASLCIGGGEAVAVAVEML